MRHHLGVDFGLLRLDDSVEVGLVVVEQKVDQLVIGDRLLVRLRDVAAEFLLKGEAEDNLKVLLG